MAEVALAATAAQPAGSPLSAAAPVPPSASPGSIAATGDGGDAFAALLAAIGPTAEMAMVAAPVPQPALPSAALESATDTDTGTVDDAADRPDDGQPTTDILSLLTLAAPPPIASAAPPAALAPAMQTPPPPAGPSGQPALRPADAPSVTARRPAADPAPAEAKAAHAFAAVRALIETPTVPADPRPSDTPPAPPVPVVAADEARFSGPTTAAGRPPASATEAAPPVRSRAGPRRAEAAPVAGVSTLASGIEPAAADASRAISSDVVPDPIARHLAVAHDGQWLDTLARDIAAAGNGDGTLRFRLDPDTLGTLTVQISQGADGASVRLTASTEAARAMLADAQPRLAAEARAQGLSLRETHVETAPQPAPSTAASTTAAAGGGGARSDGGGSAQLAQQQGGGDRRQPAAEPRQPARAPARAEHTPVSDADLYA